MNARDLRFWSIVGSGILILGSLLAWAFLSASDEAALSRQVFPIVISLIALLALSLVYFVVRMRVK